MDAYRVIRHPGDEDEGARWACRSLKPKGGSPCGVLVRERGFLVLTGMPRPVLGESCTTSIKDFAMFPPQKKKKKSGFN